MKKTTAAVIDFGTNKIITALAESGSASRCDILGTGEVPYSGYRDGQWNEPDALLEQIKSSVSAAEKQSNDRIREIFVTVPADMLELYTVESEVSVAGADKRVTEDDMDRLHDEAAELLAQQYPDHGTLIHRSPAWFTIDDGKRTMTPARSVRRAERLKGMTSFIGVKESFLKEMRDIFRQLSISVKGFVSAAMGQSSLYITYDDRDRSAVLIDVGYLNTEFSVAQGDAIVFHKVINAGGGYMMADIAEAFDQSMEDAERLKRCYDFVDPATLKTQGEPTGEDYAAHASYRMEKDGKMVTKDYLDMTYALEPSINELTEGLREAMDECSGLLTRATRVFLTGGGIARMHGAAGWLGDMLDRDVKIVSVRSANWNGPEYTSVMGALDLIFDTLDPKDIADDTLPGRLVSGVKNLWHREPRENSAEENEENTTEQELR